MILSCGACLGAAVLRVLASAIPFSSSRSRVACEGEAWASTELAAQKFGVFRGGIPIFGAVWDGTGMALGWH